MTKVLVKLAISRTDAARGQEIEVPVGEAMRMLDHNQIEQPSAKIKTAIEAHRAEIETADELEVDGLGSPSDLLALADERISELEGELKAANTAKSAALVELEQAAEKIAKLEAKLSEAASAAEKSFDDLSEALANNTALEAVVAELTKPEEPLVQEAEAKAKVGKTSGAKA